MNYEIQNASVNCMAHHEPTKIATVTASVLMTAFLLMGVFGNAWLLWTLIRCARLRQNLINNLIMSLCVNDLINLTLVQTFVLTSYYCNQWIAETFPCFIVPEANMILVGTSLWHHAFIAFHRYLVVVQWNFYLQIRKRLYIFVVILGSRIFPIILTLVFNSLAYCKYRKSRGDHESLSFEIIPHIKSFLRHFVFYSPYLLRCVYKRSEKERIICVLFLTVILPCIIVSVCFTATFMFVRRKNFHISHHLQSSQIPNDTTPSNTTLQIKIDSYLPTLENTCSEPPFLGEDDEEKSFGLAFSILGVDKGNNYRVDLQTKQLRYNRSADLISGWPKLKSTHRKRQAFSHSFLTVDKKRISREMCITKMFGVVFLLFIVGYLPYGLIRMIDGTNIDPADCTLPAGANMTSRVFPTLGTPPDVYVFLSVLYAIASCCNPLIFGLMHKDVRKNAAKIFRDLKNLCHH
ncbi:G-protein coupled receptor moody [Taenia solium]|eukprot:TsM_000210700 transcript=TsM_000210700 gene=TsM_000210700